jgi:hypothetical protein
MLQEDVHRDMKTRWTQLTDAAEITAVKDAGKYRTITWQRRGEDIWLMMDEVGRAWLETHIVGNRG